MLRKPQTVSLGKPKPRRFGGARWLGFAARIRASYRVVCRSKGALNLRWFKRHFRAIPLRNRWLMFAGFQQYQVQVSDHLHLREDFHTTNHFVALRQYPAAPRPSMQRLVRKHFSLALRSVRLLESKSVQTSVRALVRETRSVERYFAAPPLAARTPSAAPAGPTAAPNVLTIARQAEPQGNQPQDRFRRAPGSVSAPLPEVDVNRIADQVMRQMDHRIAAWRERRGRS
jgi:hypothetical protein